MKSKPSNIKYTPYSVPIKELTRSEDWFFYKWRPTMAWVYMVTCITDFIIFPILWPVLHAATHQTISPWAPVTLQGGGLFHVAMGAVLGIAAFGRTQEKLAGVGYSPFPFGSGENSMEPNSAVVTTTFSSHGEPPPPSATTVIVGNKNRPPSVDLP